MRSRRGWLIGGAIALVVAIAIGAAVSWHFSDAVLVPDHAPWPENDEVARLAPGRIVMARSEDTERPGVYGLDWPGGHAVIGAIEGDSADTVTRKLLSVHGYLAAGRKVSVEADVYSGDPREALGLRFATVRVPGELGPMLDWLIPGRGHTWAILVHGINGTPQEGLHLAPALRRSGLTSMLITYRGTSARQPAPTASTTWA